MELGRASNCMKTSNLELLHFFYNKFSLLINVMTESKCAWQETEVPADTNFAKEGGLYIEIYGGCITSWLRSQHELDGFSL